MSQKGFAHQRLLQRLQRHRSISVLHPSTLSNPVTTPSQYAAPVHPTVPAQPALRPLERADRSAVPPVQAAGRSGYESPHQIGTHPMQPSPPAEANPAQLATAQVFDQPSTRPNSTRPNSTRPNAAAPADQPQTGHAPPGSSIGNDTWGRLSRVMREHTAILDANNGEQPLSRSAGPSFLTPQQRDATVQTAPDDQVKQRCLSKAGGANPTDGPAPGAAQNGAANRLNTIKNAAGHPAPLFAQRQRGNRKSFARAGTIIPEPQPTQSPNRPTTCSSSTGCAARGRSSGRTGSKRSDLNRFQRWCESYGQYDSREPQPATGGHH